MAIVQISQITNRKGLQSNLPQLAGAELGWSTDTRQLFIGNGSLQEGAPVIGNTEILTEYSNISALFSSTQSQFTQGSYTRLIGQTATLANDTATTAVFTFDTIISPTFGFDYSIVREQTYRAGTWRVISTGSGSLTTADDGIENASTGVTISVTQSLSIVTVSFATTNTGFDATFNYSIYYLA